MSQSLISIAAVVAVWALLAARLQRWHVAMPVVVVMAGIAVGFTTTNVIGESLNTEIAQKAAEIILSVLLFVDATEVKGGLLGRDPGSALRVLFIPLPLSLGLAVVLGAWLMPGLSWTVLVLIACIVVPSDFAPAASIVSDERIPLRVRHVLNVESGYNDGVVSPVFIFALVLAGDDTHAKTPVDALRAAVPSAAKAIVIGLVLGALLALLINAAERRGFMTHQSKRIAFVVAPCFRMRHRSDYTATDLSRPSCAA